MISFPEPEAALHFPQPLGQTATLQRPPLYLRATRRPHGDKVPTRILQVPAFRQTLLLETLIPQLPLREQTLSVRQLSLVLLATMKETLVRWVLAPRWLRKVTAESRKRVALAA